MEDRFFSKMVGASFDQCILWTGAKNRKGYGEYKRDGQSRRAHREAWEMFNGPIPEGLMIMHSCDTPACCNIFHMSLGTNQDNQIDSVKKGRHAQTRKTHCRNGHEFTPDNTGINGYDGSRYCRICGRAKCAAYALKRKARATS